MKNIFNTLFNKKNKSKTISFSIVIFIYVIIEILMHITRMPRLFTSLLVPTCCYIVAALALNLVVGFSGELSLGHAGFMAIGAFSAIVCENLLINLISNEILLLFISMIVGGIFSGIFGFLISIPVLKLSGDYLAIVTLAFCQIIKSLLNNIYFGINSNRLCFSFVNNTINEDGTKMILSGAMGAINITNISNFTAGILLILFTLFVIYSLINSKFGRSIMSCRDNKIAAHSIGINSTKTKTLAFVISTILTGMAGSLFALNYTTLQPAKFDFNTSILILVYVVFGGLGSINGTIIATIVLYLLPELLRGLQDYRMLFYAIILIVMMQLTNSKKISLLFSKLKNRFLRKESHDE